MKRNAIIRIVIFSVTIAILLALLLAGLSGNAFTRRIFVNDSNSYVTGVQGVETTVDAAQVQNISIEWVSGSIIIQPGDVDAITFSESEPSSDKYAMVWKQSGNKLTIQFSQETYVNFNFGVTLNSSFSKDLVITVPRDWQCGSLEIDAADTRLEVCDLTIREVEVDSASGACQFDNCTVDTLDLDTASGDVEFNGSLNVLECDAASANLTAVLTNTPARLAMDTMSGDMDITLPAETGFTARIDAMSSDFTSDFETTYQNESYIHGNGACRINVSAMSGHITIRKGQ